MANALVDLVSLAEAKAYLALGGQTAPSDTDLAGLITGISAIIQSFLSRNLVSQSYSVTLNGADTDRIMLPNTPITAVSALSVDGVSISASANPTQAGYVFSADQVLLRGYRFTGGIQNVALTYTAGFVTIPEDYKRAFYDYLAMVLAVIDYDHPGAVEVQAGGTKIKLASGDAADLSAICGTPQITSILNQQRRVVPC